MILQLLCGVRTARSFCQISCDKCEVLHIGADRRRVKLPSVQCRRLLGIAIALDGYGRDCTMQFESPLHQGERSAIEAQLLAQSPDAVRYDVATFAEYLLDDDEDGESSLFRPCLVLPVPLADILRPLRSSGKPGNSPVGRMDARVVCNGITACGRA
jgi:hypothetical protein